MTAKEKIRKWPFERSDRYETDFYGNKIFFTRLYYKVIDDSPIRTEQHLNFKHCLAEEFVYKVEMKNGDIIEF